MAKAREHTPALRFVAIFSADVQAIERACELAQQAWGSCFRQSDDLPFDQTRYYFSAMGQPLYKRLVAFQKPIDPTELVESKQQSNLWETQIQQEFEARAAGAQNEVVERVVNIDPGYLTEAKVVLATMKDRDHRLYMGQGVFAEVTLFFQLPGRWVDSRWTYPDYKLPAYHDFFMACRQYLRDQWLGSTEAAANP